MSNAGSSQEEALQTSSAMEAERATRIRQMQDMAGVELAGSGAGLAYHPAFAAPSPVPAGATSDRSLESIVPTPQVVARGVTADGRAFERWSSGATAYAVPSPVLGGQELPPLVANVPSGPQDVSMLNRLGQEAMGTVLGLAQTAVNTVRLVNDQGWVLANGLSGGWLAAHNADALAAVQRNTALGQAISAAPAFGLRLAMGNVSLDEVGQRGSNALQLDRIEKLTAAGDYVGAQMIRTQNALGIASLAVGGEGLVVGAVDLGSSLGRTASIGTRLAAEEAAASRTMQIAGAKIEEFNYRLGFTRYVVEPDFRVAPPKSVANIAEEGALPALQRSEITAPNGRVITVVSQDGAVVPVDKVTVYARGGSPDVSLELSDLQAFKQQNRKAFDLDPANQARIDQLKNMQHNFERSQDMARNLEKIGLPNTMENNNVSLKNLLDTGRSVTAENQWAERFLAGE